MRSLMPMCAGAESGDEGTHKSAERQVMGIDSFFLYGRNAEAHARLSSTCLRTPVSVKVLDASMYTFCSPSNAYAPISSTLHTKLHQPIFTFWCRRYTCFSPLHFIVVRCYSSALCHVNTILHLLIQWALYAILSR